MDEGGGQLCSPVRAILRRFSFFHLISFCSLPPFRSFLVFSFSSLSISLFSLSSSGSRLFFLRILPSYLPSVPSSIPPPYSSLLPPSPASSVKNKGTKSLSSFPLRSIVKTNIYFFPIENNGQQNGIEQERAERGSSVRGCGQTGIG